MYPRIEVLDPFTNRERWRWQPVELPVVPVYPITCPRDTDWPTDTAMDCICPDLVTIELPFTNPWFMVT